MPGSTPQVHQSGGVRYRPMALRSLTVALGLLAASTVFALAQDAPPGAVLRPWEPPDAVSIPDKNDQMRMHEQQQQKKQINYAAANLERKRQIAADTAKLLELANDLKQEVDKTDKDTMSLDVIKKAETIEKLAKSVKEKMKQTSGPI